MYEDGLSQRRAIKELLLDGGTITQGEALKWFGCGRLASRIWELREGKGDPGGRKMDIESVPIKNEETGKKYTMYRLRRPPKPVQAPLPLGEERVVGAA